MWPRQDRHADAKGPKLVEVVSRQSLSRWPCAGVENEDVAASLEAQASNLRGWLTQGTLRSCALVSREAWITRHAQRALARRWHRTLCSSSRIDDLTPEEPPLTRDFGTQWYSLLLIDSQPLAACSRPGELPALRQGGAGHALCAPRGRRRSRPQGALRVRQGSLAGGRPALGTGVEKRAGSRSPTESYLWIERGFGRSLCRLISAPGPLHAPARESECHPGGLVAGITSQCATATGWWTESPSRSTCGPSGTVASPSRRMVVWLSRWWTWSGVVSPGGLRFDQ